MQTIIQIVCKPGGSLRDEISSDSKLEDHGLLVTKEKQLGRDPGWTKIKSTFPERQGTINLEWLDSTNMLSCRVINKRTGRPNLIVGDFVDYLSGQEKVSGSS